MDRELIARRLLEIARGIMAEGAEREAAWTPVRKDVNVGLRNEEAWKSLTTFAPGLSKEVRNRITASLQKDGYMIRESDLKLEWREYLTFVDPEDNHNKYHYYVVYSFPVTGQPMYVAVNASGRIGIVERAYDLTKKFQHGPASSLARAIAAAEVHMREKLRKGYEPAPMTRG